MDLIAANCLVNDDGINPSYRLKLLMIEADYETGIRTKVIASTVLNRRVKDIEILESPLERDDLYVVVLTEDSLVYLIEMECEDSYSCSLESYSTFTGQSLGLDQFVVNSFMLIKDEHLFVISVDNFGLIVIDLITRKVVEYISFNLLIKDFPLEFIIYKILPINNDGIRVLLKSLGGFSVFWEEVGTIGDKDFVLYNQHIANSFTSIPGEITTNLITNSEFGIAQVIYYRTNSQLFDVFVRIYNNMNHENSKVYSEIPVDRLAGCEMIQASWDFNRTCMVCGSKIYLTYFEMYPQFTFDKDFNNLTLAIDIVAQNRFSNQTISLIMTKSGADVDFSRAIVFLMFVG